MAATASKAELRELALARRSALGQSERAKASEIAVRYLAGLVRLGEAVSLFSPIRDEVDPTGLFDWIRVNGGRVLLPAVAGAQIVFRLHEAGAPLETGSFGTRHPPDTAQSFDPDLIIAPLAAFDDNGNRIGYGGGYYDKATARLEKAGHPFRFVGIAFSCQQVEAVPAEVHDRKLDAIITENGPIWFPEQQ